MNRREFFKSSSLLPGGAAAALAMLDNTEVKSSPLPPLPFQGEKSQLKITSIRMVKPRPKRPVPSYTPTPGSFSTGEMEIANPMSIYPKYKAKRSLFMADDLGPEVVEISTDKGVKGIGYGGPGAGFVIEKHLTKLLLGADPFEVEQLWDIMWRSTLYYGRKGLVIHAISAVDLALWDSN
jgi:L-rhamnonate dehydratase